VDDATKTTRIEIEIRREIELNMDLYFLWMFLADEIETAFL
jgi:hypothetical protein